MGTAERESDSELEQQRLVTAAGKVGSQTITATNGSISGSAAITTYAVPTSSWQGINVKGFSVK